MSYPELSVFPPLQSQFELHIVRSMPEQKWKTIKSFCNIFNASKDKNSFKRKKKNISNFIYKIYIVLQKMFASKNYHTAYIVNTRRNFKCFSTF